MKHLSLLLVILAAASTFSACSTRAVERRQAALTDAHASALERREARRAARDERFRASREAVLN